jgi:hypothetical protein
MSDFLGKSGEFSYVTVALLSFLFGMLGANIVDHVRRARERIRLIDLFVQDIRRNWRDVDDLSSAQAGPEFFRIRFGIRGVYGLSFQGNPEYIFEVYNLKLFETEGIKLAQLLPAAPRKELWGAYSLMRNAEQVREVLSRIDNSHPDFHSYQRLFVELVRRLLEQLFIVEQLLWAERSWWNKLLRGCLGSPDRRAKIRAWATRATLPTWNGVSFRASSQPPSLEGGLERRTFVQ